MYAREEVESKCLEGGRVRVWVGESIKSGRGSLQWQGSVTKTPQGSITESLQLWGMLGESTVCGRWDRADGYRMVSIGGEGETSTKSSGQRLCPESPWTICH